VSKNQINLMSKLNEDVWCVTHGLGAFCLCMATTLEVCGCHPKCETFDQTILKDLGPPSINPSTCHFFLP
jgi:hypothetical protein